MVIAEIILYFSVLALYFLFKPIKKLLRLNKPIIAPEDNERYITDEFTFSDKIKSKPLWKLEAHYAFLIILIIFLMLALPGGLTYAMVVLQKTFIFTAPNTIYFGENMGIACIPFFFICLPIATMIPESFLFKTTRYAGIKLHNQPTLPRKLDRKYSLRFLIVCFAVGFPFIILSSVFYFSINSESFNINKYLSFSEKSYELPLDIKFVELTYEEDGRNNYEFYYNVYFNDGSELEILNEDRIAIEPVVQVNQIFIDSDVSINLAPISDEQWISIENNESYYFDGLKTIYDLE